MQRTRYVSTQQRRTDRVTRPDDNNNNNNITTSNNKFSWHTHALQLKEILLPQRGKTLRSRWWIDIVTESQSQNLKSFLLFLFYTTFLLNHSVCRSFNIYNFFLLLLLPFQHLLVVHYIPHPLTTRLVDTRHLVLINRRTCLKSTTGNLQKCPSSSSNVRWPAVVLLALSTSFYWRAVLLLSQYKAVALRIICETAVRNQKTILWM